MSCPCFFFLLAHRGTNHTPAIIFVRLVCSTLCTFFSFMRKEFSKLIIFGCVWRKPEFSHISEFDVKKKKKGVRNPVKDEGF